MIKFQLENEDENEITLSYLGCFFDFNHRGELIQCCRDDYFKVNKRNKKRLESAFVEWQESRLEEELNDDSPDEDFRGYNFRLND